MRFESLAGWLDWQTGLNPSEIRLGLDRVAQVWARLGSPALAAPVITVAGTNGKGSSVAFAEAMLQAAGYRTGCYTSPHLLHYNERVRIDQQQVSDEMLCDAFERIDDARGDIPLTYFEFGTLAALWLFASAGLDAVVLEVGLGGRLDAVNIIDPDVALITRIGLDHQAWLGNDIDSIAREKAGIMRFGRPVIFSGAELPRGISDAAAERGARLLAAGRDYRIERRADAWDLVGPTRARRSLPLPRMRGPHQLDNAAGVIVALDCVTEQLPLDQKAVRSGLLQARVSGRFEVRPGAPTWILDVAHNPQAAATLDAMLGDLFCGGRRICVCGMLGDKDAAGFARALARRFDAWYLVDLNESSRGLSADALAARIAPLLDGRPLQAGGTVAQTLRQLAETCTENDQVVVCGSFLTVGQALAWLDAPMAPAGS